MKNRITSHGIGASGCDGSVLGFIKSRESRLKYSELLNANFEGIFEKLTSISIVCPNNSDFKALVDEIKSLRNAVKSGQNDITEAVKTLETLNSAITCISGLIDEDIKINDEALKILNEIP